MAEPTITLAVRRMSVRDALTFDLRPVADLAAELGIPADAVMLHLVPLQRQGYAVVTRLPRVGLVAARR